MPKRSNEFQKLVTLIQRTLAPKGAKVTESYLMDTGTGETREIDVLIEDSVGPYRIKIAVEVKDHFRKMDSTQFEAILGKYSEGGVKVDKVVIVTSSGFYQPVIDRAKKLGIHLIKLQKAERVRWGQLLSRNSPFKSPFHICSIEVYPAPLPDISRETLQNGVIRSTEDGRIHDRLSKYAFKLFNDHILKNQLDELREADLLAEQSASDQKYFAEVALKHQHTISVNGQEYPIEKIKFCVHFMNDFLGMNSVKSEMHLQYAPHICKIQLVPSIEHVDQKKLLKEGHFLCTCCPGKDHGSIVKWAHEFVAEKVYRKNPALMAEFNDCLKESPDGQAWMTITNEIHPRRFVRFEQNDFKVAKVKIIVHAISAKAPVECKQYEMQTIDGEETIVTHLQATAAGKEFNMLISHADGEPSEKVMVNIASTKNKQA